MVIDEMDTLRRWDLVLFRPDEAAGHPTTRCIVFRPFSKLQRTILGSLFTNAPWVVNTGFDDAVDCREKPTAWKLMTNASVSIDFVPRGAVAGRGL